MKEETYTTADWIKAQIANRKQKLIGLDHWIASYLLGMFWVRDTKQVQIPTGLLKEKGWYLEPFADAMRSRGFGIIVTADYIYITIG